METIFPTEEGFQGFFVVGFRKMPNNPMLTERTGTVILKRTYDIDPVSKMLTGADEQLPIFIKDRPDNFITYSFFGTENDDNPDVFWQPDGAAINKFEDPDITGNYLLQVTGSASGTVVQTLAFDKPLGGRQFWLSFEARCEDSTTARIENVQLKSNDHVICSISRNLTGTIPMQRFAENGTWPADLKATEMDVVLRMATDSSRTVFYDNVQVEERDHLTVWDPDITLKYENDLAAFKPQGDLIVLGLTDIAGPCSVKVDGSTWLRRNVILNNAREKAVFGWEPRGNGDYPKLRQKKAGGFSSNADDYPLEWPFTDPIRDPLPGGPGDPRTPRFENIFYNGFRRHNPSEGIIANSPFLYLPASAHILIERDFGSNYGFALSGDSLSAAYSFYSGTGPDNEENWQNRSLAINLDTLVVEPEINRCYTVWRGVWPFDEHNEADYRKLQVSLHQQ